MNVEEKRVLADSMQVMLVSNVGNYLGYLLVGVPLRKAYMDLHMKENN